MKLSLPIFLFLSFYLIKGIFSGINSLTYWKDPIYGNSYDFSSLKRPKNNPYIIIDPEKDDDLDFSLKYIFNIGKEHNSLCNNKKSIIAEFLEYKEKNTNICEILGTFDSKNIYLIDENNPNIGIILEYGNGDICTASQNEELNGLPRKTRFKLVCSEKQDEFFLNFDKGTQGSTKCIMEFVIHTPAGCPLDSIFKMMYYSDILLILIISFGLYFVFGYIYNRKYYSLSGVKAIPHIGFWKEFPWLVIEGINTIKNSFRYMFKKYFWKEKRKTIAIS